MSGTLKKIHVDGVDREPTAQEIAEHDKACAEIAADQQNTATEGA